MEITDVETFVDSTGNCFVKLETETGLYGIGQGGLTRRPLAVAAVIDEYAAELIGADATRIEHLWQVLFRGAGQPGGVIQSAALSAVDIALWDLRGKALGVPVYELLGGRTRDRVPGYPHIGERRDIDRLVENCQSRMDEGWRFVRWGLDDPTGPDPHEPDRAARFGIEQVKAVREVCGDELRICVDVHTRLDPASAINFCQGVEPYDPYFIEDPIRSENKHKLEHIRRHTSVPLAVGEQFDSKWAFQPVLENNLAEFCRMDVCIIGGLTEARKIAGWCETNYIYLAPHNPGKLGAVSTAACLHLCLASPLVGVLELSSPPGTTQTESFPIQVPYEEGHLLPPDRPGLGIEFDESAMSTVDAYERTGGVGLRRDDGSYTNW